jgi:hypothetical protein
MTVTTDCHRCGVAFSWEREANKPGRLRRYCSQECRNDRTKVVDEKCKACGCDLQEHVGRGRPRQYCSEDCRRASVNSDSVRITCKCCGGGLPERKPGKGRYPHFCSLRCRVKWTTRSRQPRMGPVHDRQCKVCAASFSTKLAHHWTCSPECRRKATNAVRRARPLVATGESQCAYCGNTFTTTRDKRLVCNRNCARKLQASRSCVETRRRLLEAKTKKLRERRKTCIRCSHVYLALPFQKLALCRACSKGRVKPKAPHPEGFTYSCNTCGRLLVRNRRYDVKPKCVACVKADARIANSERRRRYDYWKRSSLKSGGKTFRRSEIFQRDKWSCQLCGIKVRRTKEYAPDQATIDHIAPLSKGGVHSPENCQCACQACNSTKSDRMGGLDACHRGSVEKRYNYPDMGRHPSRVGVSLGDPKSETVSARTDFI